MLGCESNQLEFPRVNILPRSNSFFGRTEIGNWAGCTTFLKAILYYKEAHRHTQTHTHTLSHTQLCYIKYFNINQKEFFVFWNASLSSMNFLFLLIKFYWETVMPTHFPVVCNCFHSTIAELIGCNKDNIAHKAKNIYCMILSRKCCLPLE